MHPFLNSILTNSICSMSDPGTTYRTREEIQRMRSTQDPIKGLQKYLEDWGVSTEEELKVNWSIYHFRVYLTHCIFLIGHR